MKFGPYLALKQPLVYRSFAAALESSRLPHAFLLSGEKGTPLSETALYLAQSLLCDKPNPLACEECRSCLRLEHRTYADFALLDGEEGTIKKEDVQSLVASFSRTPLESKGRLLYIVHLAENMTPEAANALLKFLEEPTPNTYAFLTTENVTRLLPTIVSRCEVLRLLLAPREEVIAEALTLGVALEDAQLLASFANSGPLLVEEAATPDYQAAKKSFLQALAALAKPKEEAQFIFENAIVPALPSKEDARYFLDMLSLAFKDALAQQEGQAIALSSYATLIKPLSETLPQLKSSLLEILKARNDLDLNVGMPLLFYHLVSLIAKE